MSQPKDDELIAFCVKVMGWESSTTVDKWAAQVNTEQCLTSLDAAVAVAVASSCNYWMLDCNIAGAVMMDEPCTCEPHDGTAPSMARALVTACFRASEEKK